MHLTLPYLGGFFDADGSTSLVRFSKLTAKTRIRSVTYAPAISMSQSDLGFLESVGKMLDGKVNLSGPAGSITKHGIRKTRDSYTILWTHKAAVRVGELLLPHLIIKRDEVNAVVNFHNKWNNYTKGWGRSSALSEEYLARKQEVIDAGEACRELLKSIRLNKNTVMPNALPA